MVRSTERTLQKRKLGKAERQDNYKCQNGEGTKTGRWVPSGRKTTDRRGHPNWGLNLQ